MTKEITNETIELLNPSYIERVKQFKEKNLKFIQYTSANNALNIIKDQELWLSNVRQMNDSTEVSHGIETIRKYLQDEKKYKHLFDSLNNIHEGCAEQIFNKFDQNIQSLYTNTFIACFSEHDLNSHFDGKLSMWRGYGKNSKCAVGIVINPNLFFQEAEGFHAFTVPVLYESSVDKELSLILCNINNHSPKFKALEINDFVSHIIFQLIRISLTIKHPGFEEEKEWRIIYNPDIYLSKFINEEVVTKNGLPQIVQKIKFKDEATIDLFNNSSILNELNHLLIGPAGYEIQNLVGNAMLNELVSLDCENPSDKIRFSGIPFRE